MTHPMPESADVVVLGAGLAGLTLARQLLLETDRTVVVLERREVVPPERQKVGESSVQLGGFYLSKVLDLEEHLLHEHFMKYNLRFYWKTAGRSNRGLEDYHQQAIRPFSNLASYQVDRNVLEGELLRLVEADPRATVARSVRDLVPELADSDGGSAATFAHAVRFTVPDGAEGSRLEHTVRATWVVDTTGRGRVLAKREGLRRPTSIRHGAFFWWVDGLVDIERLTDRSRREVRRAGSRREVGHLPLWLATNHFCGEGFWFWVIPLRGKTSLGLVFDRDTIDPSEVFSVDKATEWIAREFPLFADDLRQREVLDFGGYRDVAHDCARTISPSRWAMAGEAGRFSDPLYSPGTDLISIYNTLIVDAIAQDAAAGHDDEALAARCATSEALMRSVFSAYEPSYATSYDALGDPEVFALKYAWELSIYFAFFVFPFVNDLLTERRFVPSFLRAFSRLGPRNRSIQALVSDYYQWKKEHREPLDEPVVFDYFDFATLRRAETTFYEMEVGIERARQVLHEQLDHLEELAAFITAHIAAEALGDPSLRADRRFADRLEQTTDGAVRFDLDAFAAIRDELAEDRRDDEADEAEEARPWSFEPDFLEVFATPRRSHGEAAEATGQPTSMESVA